MRSASVLSPSRLVVHPGRNLKGTVEPPGDKSITHRAFLLGALAEGTTVVESPNPGADCLSTLACLEALGAGVQREPGRVSIRGCAMRLTEPDRMLDCGNSGTTLRLLAGPLAGQPFLAILAGDDSLSRRPVDRVIDPLRRMGARLWARAEDRLPPLVIKGGPLEAIHYRVPVPSAQVASCVLLAGLFARGKTTVELGAARDHTERMLPAFGVAVDVPTTGLQGSTPRSVTGPAQPRGIRLGVPGDFSAAAFFLAAAAATPGASVTATNVGLNPTRTGLLTVLERMGARVDRARERLEGGEPIGDVTVSGPEALRGVDLDALAPGLLPTMIDEVPAWTIAASRARGTSRLTHAHELRLKESDRIAALARGLAQVGVEVEEQSDGLTIRGGPVQGGTVVAAAGDHRIAMAFALLGTLAQRPITVTGTREIATSYPGFVPALRALGGEVEVPDEDVLPSTASGVP